MLTDQAEAGLLSYLAGPVGLQIADEVGTPREAAFVFGHTHKPFAAMRRPSGLPGPMPVVNTGGWVVDSPQPEPNKGAAVVLIDQDLNIALVRCYTQGAEPGEVEVEGPGDQATNPLVDELQSTIDPVRDPWRALADAAAATERDRRRQLRTRLEAETRLVNEAELPHHQKPFGV